MRAELLELITPSVCPGCDAPRREGALRLCSTCTGELIPLPRLREVHTVLAYAGRGALLLRRFKFEHRLDALAVLLGLLISRVRPFRFDGVVPVPRHPQRVRELGSDPTFELAHALTRQIGSPLWDGVLRRKHPTRSQTSLDSLQRRWNVRGSFQARPASLRGRTALLLDDITTTGATLREAASELHNTAGAKRVVRVALEGTIEV